MTFEIRIKDRPLKFISGLQKKEREALKDIFLTMKEDPVPFKTHDTAKMKGYKHTYRIRKGKIRIVYEVRWGHKIIHVHRVEFRGRAYK